MKNMTTEDFCRRFGACAEGARFALKYETMRECYAALLKGAAGDKSAEWAIWTVCQGDVMSDRDRRLFAVKCARRVQHLMTDERSVAALDVAERYAHGEATEKEMDAAGAAAWAAAGAAAGAAARDAAWDVAGAAARDAAGDAAGAAAWAAARDAARDVAGAAARDAAGDAAGAAAWAAAWAAAGAAARDAAWDAAWDAERREQLKFLAEFGNPFEEEAAR